MVSFCFYKYLYAKLPKKNLFSIQNLCPLPDHHVYGQAVTMKMMSTDKIEIDLNCLKTICINIKTIRMSFRQLLLHL